MVEAQTNKQDQNNGEPSDFVNLKHFGTVIVLLLLIFWLTWPQDTFHSGVPTHRKNPRTIVRFQHIFADQNDDRFAEPTLYNKKDVAVHGWFTRLLPFLEQEDVSKLGRYDRIDFEYPYNHPLNASLFKGSTENKLELVPKIEPTADSQGYGLIHYSLNERIFPGNRSLTLEFFSHADGLSNTLLLGEIEQGLPAWGAPGNARDPSLGLRPSPDTFGVSVHGGVTIVGFADGRVSSINNDIDPAVLKALSTPDGGEEVPDW